MLSHAALIGNPICATQNLHTIFVCASISRLTLLERSPSTLSPHDPPATLIARMCQPRIAGRRLAGQ